MEIRLETGRTGTPGLLVWAAVSLAAGEQAGDPRGRLPVTPGTWRGGGFFCGGSGAKVSVSGAGQPPAPSSWGGGGVVAALLPRFPLRGEGFPLECPGPREVELE